jgi:hypothetical protein
MPVDFNLRGGVIMCGIEALLACFSLSGFYVDGALSAHDRGQGRAVTQQVTTERADCFKGSACMRYDYTTNATSIDRSPQNAYGRVAIGYDVTVRQFALRLEASHESSIATGRDRGVNAVTLGLTWRPFK